MNRPFFLRDFSHAELALLANLMSFGSVQHKTTGEPTPPPKTEQHGRVEVVYIDGCFKEAQNIKRWLDVNTGVLYNTPDRNHVANSGFVAAGAHYGKPVFVNKSGDQVRFMQHTVVPVQLPEQETHVAVTYVVGTVAFNSEYAAIYHAKHKAIAHPCKEFTVEKVVTTKVVTKSKPYKVTETAQVKTVQTKSWE